MSARDGRVLNELTEVARLDGTAGLVDASALADCTKLTALSLRDSPQLISPDGLQMLGKLWTVDLRGCSLKTCAPLVELGALSELQLGHNKLTLQETLQLRPMAIGQLGLQGNPLMDGIIRSALGVKPGVDDSKLLRSFLADELPCVIAIDDSFVTSTRAPRNKKTKKPASSHAHLFSLSLCVCVCVCVLTARRGACPLPRVL